MTDLLSTRDVCEAAGVTRRQLEWWEQQGVLTPTKSGTWLRYSQMDLQLVVVVAQLRARGFRLQRIAKLLPVIRRKLSLSSSALITDGEVVHVVDGSEFGFAIDFATRSTKPVVLFRIARSGK